MKNIIIAAGGTGGHINSALAIGEYYESKGYQAHYFSGRRYLDYQLYKGKKVYHLNVLGLRYSNIFKIFKSLILNSFTFLKMFFLVLKLRPAFAIGTGGYVCGPVLLACWISRVPAFILEQNAVLGLTNRILAYFVEKLFVHFKETKKVPEKLKRKVVVVGNPIKFQFKKKKKDQPENNILIFGGSLGATQINKALEVALKEIPQHNFKIIHQTGKNNEAIVVDKGHDYQALNYLDNIEKYYHWADKIICRAGASTIAELRMVAKPTLLVPFPAATDDHQTINANLLKEEVDFSVSIAAKNISIQELAKKMVGFIEAEDLQEEESDRDGSLDLIAQEIAKSL